MAVPTTLRARRFWAAVAGACALCAGAPGHAAFQDPLDTPAMASPLAQKRLLNGLALAGKRIVAVGQRGHILYSDDSGASWKQAAVPASSDLTAVHFASAKRGWAVGHDGIVLATEDGGASWAKQLDGRGVGKLLVAHFAEHDPRGLDAETMERLRADARRFAEEGPDKPFLDVWFEDERTGYVVGAFNLIFRTTDGGTSWIPWFDRTDNPKLLHFYAIRRVGGEVFVVGEQGLVLRLDAAAQRFRKVPVDYAGTFFGITGKAGVAIAYGLRGNVFRSTDGGARWSKVDTGLETGLTGSTVTPDGRIVLVSQAGHLLASEDDGASFRALKQQNLPASAVLAVGADSLVISGLRGLRAAPAR